MPIVDGSLKGQVFEIETRMAKRVEDVFIARTQGALDGVWTRVSPKQVLDRLLIMYENAVTTMVEEVIKPVEAHVRHGNQPMTPTMQESAEVVKRLNKGYLRFVYDTTEARLAQYFEETEAKEALNPDDDVELVDTTPDGGGTAGLGL